MSLRHNESQLTQGVLTDRLRFTAAPETQQLDVALPDLVAV